VDQGSLNASTAFAVAALVGYFEACSTGHVLDASALFLYQVALKTLGLNGNASVNFRTTLKSLVRFGMPPESYWPYEASRFESTPADPFLFSYGRDYETIHYFRLDASNGETTLRNVKAYLAAGFAVAFGFPVPSSLTTDADIAFRPDFDSIRGGQAVLAAGYDDDRRIASDTGALLFRCSWGSRWGEHGYGWLPYRYVIHQAAVDFWTVVRREWIKAGVLSRPILNAD
jgi:C1A family cysteine protease